MEEKCLWGIIDELRDDVKAHIDAITDLNSLVDDLQAENQELNNHINRFRLMMDKFGNERDDLRKENDKLKAENEKYFNVDDYNTLFKENEKLQADNKRLKELNPHIDL